MCEQKEYYQAPREKNISEDDSQAKVEQSGKIRGAVRFQFNMSGKKMRTQSASKAAAGDLQRRHQRHPLHPPMLGRLLLDK